MVLVKQYYSTVTKLLKKFPLTKNTIKVNKNIKSINKNMLVYGRNYNKNCWRISLWDDEYKSIRDLQYNFWSEPII